MIDAPARDPRRLAAPDHVAAVVFFTTWGSVRGPCGHRHQRAETARGCLERDRRRCAQLPGSGPMNRPYSDRRVYRMPADAPPSRAPKVGTVEPEG